MNDLRTAAQQFVTDYENGDLGDLKHYARALRTALAQQEQEPVAKYSDIVSDGGMDPRNKFDHPPRREWQSLTEGEIGDVFQAARNAKLGSSNDNSRHRLSVVEIARAIEQALKEKNQ